MVVIPVRVCGDAWSNIDEVRNLLYEAPRQENISLDFFAEGPSMQAIGLVDLLDQYCADTGRNPNSITVINNSNNAEKTAYKNMTPGISHFFKYAKNYWQPIPIPDPDAKTFAFFIGRKTIARGWILYDLYHAFRDDFVFSNMHDRNAFPWKTPPAGVNLESIADWIPNFKLEKFEAWFDSCPVTSLDGKTVRNQFEPGYNTNLDILAHYDKFMIELVAETYTLGDTFFPTEKTVRPIMAGRPFLIYGPRHFLRRLRALGFETYGSCWDESYDELEGPARWQAIRQLLPQIKFTDTCWKIAQKNHRNLERIVYDNTNF